MNTKCVLLVATELCVTNAISFHTSILRFSHIESILTDSYILSVESMGHVQASYATFTKTTCREISGHQVCNGGLGLHSVVACLAAMCVIVLCTDKLCGIVAGHMTSVTMFLRFLELCEVVGNKSNCNLVIFLQIAITQKQKVPITITQKYVINYIQLQM